MLQACPFCGMEHPIIVRGNVKNPETLKDGIVEDKGYSFCNCKNIWYTDWDNMDSRVYDNKYSEKYDISLTRKLFDLACEVHFPIFKEHHANIKKFADIGAIHHGILDNAKKQGWETLAVDINESINHTGHRAIIGNIEDAEVVRAMDHPDVIWMSHVIEHLRRPLDTVQMIHQELNKGGLFYVAMPDPYFIDWANVYQWGHWHLREHHIMWDMDTFIKECEKIGFKCVYRNRNLLTAYICVRDFQLILQKI